MKVVVKSNLEKKGIDYKYVDATTSDGQLLMKEKKVPMCVPILIVGNEVYKLNEALQKSVQL